MGVFDGNSLSSSVYTLLIMSVPADPCLVEGPIPHPSTGSGIIHIRFMAVRASDAQRRHKHVRVTFLHAGRCWRQQESAVRRVYSNICGEVFSIIADTLYIKRSHSCKKLICLLSYYGNTHSLLILAFQESRWHFSYL